MSTKTTDQKILSEEIHEIKGHGNRKLLLKGKQAGDLLGHVDVIPHVNLSDMTADGEEHHAYAVKRRNGKHGIPQFVTHRLGAFDSHEAAVSAVKKFHKIEESVVSMSTKKTDQDIIAESLQEYVGESSGYQNADGSPVGPRSAAIIDAEKSMRERGLALAVDEPELGFSHDPCEMCGSYKGGNRAGIAVLKRRPKYGMDHAYTIHACDDCAAYVANGTLPHDDPYEPELEESVNRSTANVTESTSSPAKGVKTVHFDKFSIDLPHQAINDCSHSGSCDADVDRWHTKLNLKIDPNHLRDELKQHGAWNDKELGDHEQNLKRILWIAAGNAKDEEHEMRESSSLTESETTEVIGKKGKHTLSRVTRKNGTGYYKLDDEWRADYPIHYPHNDKVAFDNPEYFPKDVVSWASDTVRAHAKAKPQQKNESVSPETSNQALVKEGTPLVRGRNTGNMVRKVDGPQDDESHAARKVWKAARKMSPEQVASLKQKTATRLWSVARDLAIADKNWKEGESEAQINFGKDWFDSKRTPEDVYSSISDLVIAHSKAYRRFHTMRAIHTGLEKAHAELTKKSGLSESTSKHGSTKSSLSPLTEAKLKMHPDHYAELKSRVSALADRIPGHVEAVRQSGKFKDLGRRVRFDVLAATRLQKDHDLYANGVNNDHIDSALRSVFKELNIKDS